MAGYCTRRQHFHSPSARVNTSAHSCNIQPYFTFTRAIIYMYMHACSYIKHSCTHSHTCHSHPHPYTLTPIHMHTPLVSHACQQASSHKDTGNYSRASSFGRAALCFNILAIVYFILLIIVIVVVLTILFLGIA